jgi:hypothetical protein
MSTTNERGENRMEQLNYKDAYYHLFNGISDMCAALSLPQHRQHAMQIRRQLEKLQCAGEDICIGETPVISLFCENE